MIIIINLKDRCLKCVSAPQCQRASAGLSCCRSSSGRPSPCRCRRCAACRCCHCCLDWQPANLKPQKKSETENFLWERKIRNGTHNMRVLLQERTETIDSNAYQSRFSRTLWREMFSCILEESVLTHKNPDPFLLLGKLRGT